ncbi:hypothetical protein BX661DRAFT_171644 [Kickxella alabastrina]|uniref:uncharacterized protein n=1 Tax=Kickxella alabastrina TaxID=61397 RepID=UPI00221E3EB9|nr:uncharacterized protein BX661DRAFT_171644 [Kickxella alabastrina]KAI7826375.1 hypothetical protein BX661DRAFT_171644 [Kickxella alabastrina]
MSASELQVATGPLPAAAAPAQLMPSVYSGFAKLAEHIPCFDGKVEAYPLSIWVKSVERIFAQLGVTHPEHKADLTCMCLSETVAAEWENYLDSLDASGPATFDDLRSYLEITFETISSSFHGLQKLNQLRFMADADLLAFHQEFDHLICCEKMDNPQNALDWYRFCLPKEFNKDLFSKDIDSLTAAKATVQQAWSTRKMLREEGVRKPSTKTTPKAATAHDPMAMEVDAINICGSSGKRG